MQRLATTLALGVFTSAAAAQFSVVIPNGTATAPGNTSNAFPWGTTASGFPGLRLMCVYDASNFTAQNVTGPILINQLRWRPDDTTAAVTGGTFAVADVRLSTAPMDYTGLTTNFATNHGPDLTTVYSGPVTHTATPGAGAWTPTSWCVDITLTTPFLYDPNAGDLVIDCDYLGGGNFSGGTVGQMDVQGPGSMSGRIWASTNYPAANGSALDHGVVVEVTYLPPAGAATVASFGSGCYDRASATFYETFPANSFDLSNTSIQLLPSGSGYVAVPGSNTWFTPVAAPIPLTDDSVSTAQPLGFVLNYPGGSTTDVYIASNGFVWAQSSTINGCCAGDPIALRSQGARWALLWNDLNPGVGGTVTFDTDPANSAAYVTFTNVPEYGQAANLNTFQVAFFQSGIVEYRFGGCAITNHTALTGWSPGVNAQDPGPVDISTAMPIVTLPDLVALRLACTPRPIVGTAVSLTTTNVPTGSPLGALLFGLAQLNPGIDLAGIGMPGCRQYLGIDSTVIFLPVGGTGTVPFAIPNNTAFSGVHIQGQTAVFAAGLNALGVITSNGVDLGIGIN